MPFVMQRGKLFLKGLVLIVVPFEFWILIQEGDDRQFFTVLHKCGLLLVILNYERAQSNLRSVLCQRAFSSLFQRVRKNLATNTERLRGAQIERHQRPQISPRNRWRTR